ALPVVTDADGSFSTRLRQGAESVVVVHEAGFAHLPVGMIPRDGIALEPWGAIEGVVLVAGQPAASQRVMLRAWLPESDATPRGVELDTQATTDAQGQFRFDHVPPGPVALSRHFKFSPGKTGLAGNGPRQRVEVPPGGVAEVTLATQGRAVIGRLALSQGIPGHQWRDDLQQLVELRPDLPSVTVGAPDGNPEFLKQMRAFERREAQIRKFFPDVQPDGSFRMEDVPPGSYTLQLGVSRPPTDPDDEDQRFFRPPLGKLSVAVEVPEGEEPLDLGTLTIPVKVP
ncbi:MAG: hypothetical protein J0L84_03800, partial [Verrucomicrobia bacterium]|nr:hypothetical protein [Verrucomicrobiota bacterium]